MKRPLPCIRAYFLTKTMPFIENHARALKILGAPFTPIYATASAIRNWCFDSGRKTSTAFPFPVICVGNLCAGGSGKTPMTEYLIRLLAPGFSLGVVSRGYGRQDRHNLLVQEGMTARQTGDEPLQYFLKFNELIPKRFAVYLATKRVEGIRELKQLRPDCQIVLLDDAYQHRHVQAGLNILLTEYGKPFFKDHLLPWGNLRESRKQSKRAQIIVVTKCPENLDEAGKKNFLEECPLLPGQDIFFSKIAYDPLQFVQNPLSSNQPDTALQVAPVLTDEPTSPGKIGNGNGQNSKNLLLITGIAHPEPLQARLESQGFNILEHFRFGDHHAFNQPELEQIARTYHELSTGTSPKPFILTTEKDMTRLVTHPGFALLSGIPLAFLPIRTCFLFGDGERFDRQILEFAARTSNAPIHGVQ